MSDKASNEMANNMAKRMAVDCLGAGCASLSLAARASEFTNHHFTIIDPETHKADDHIWGFWAMPWLHDASDGARKQWFKWRIISPGRMIERSSQNHPYSAIHRYEWLEKCRKKALAAGVSFRPEPAPKQALQILDSRQPSMKGGMMLQHFPAMKLPLIVMFLTAQQQF